MAHDKASSTAAPRGSVPNPFVLGFDLWNQLAQQQLLGLQELHKDMLDFAHKRHVQARQLNDALTSMFDENLALMTETARNWYPTRPGDVA